jgi:hypothetical protein
MKTYWGAEVSFHAFLTSALGGGEWSASYSGHITPMEKAPSSHWIGGCMCPGAELKTQNMMYIHFFPFIM